MTLLRPADHARFIEKGCLTAPVILLYGPDDGRIRASINQIVATLLGPKPDALARVDMDAEALNADPPRLADERASMGMFSEKRVVIVRQAGKLTKTLWQHALADVETDSGCTLLLDGGDLAKTSPLRSAAESMPNIPVLALYPPDRGDLETLATRMLAQASIRTQPDAIRALCEDLGADYGLAVREIEKLALYLGTGGTLAIGDHRAIVPAAGGDSESELIDDAFESNIAGIEHKLLPGLGRITTPGTLIILTLAHILMLIRLSEAQKSGSLDRAFASERLFFRRKDRVRAQLRRWEEANLLKALDTIRTAQEQGRKNPALEENLAIRMLWSIATLARKR